MNHCGLQSPCITLTNNDDDDECCDNQDNMDNLGAPNDYSGMSASPSFSLETSRAIQSQSSFGAQLTAVDIFSGSNQIIKRPSTMLAGDGMSQVAQVLSFGQATSAAGGETKRNRRQAIVPAKVATDPDSDTRDDDDEGGEKLVNLSGSDDADEGAAQVAGGSANGAHSEDSRMLDRARILSQRRKRSGGQAEPKTRQAHDDSLVRQHILGGSETRLPSFVVVVDKDVESDRLTPSDDAHSTASTKPKR